jgi:hypothetical protein
MKKLAQLALCLAVAGSTAACFGYERGKSPTSPSAAGSGSLMGNWTSSSLIPTPSTCADFKWNVTEQTATAARGSFSATCANDLKLTGTAQGSLSGSTIDWSAQGVANAPGRDFRVQHQPEGHGRDRRDIDPRAVLRRYLPRKGERRRDAESSVGVI